MIEREGERPQPIHNYISFYGEDYLVFAVIEFLQEINPRAAEEIQDRYAVELFLSHGGGAFMDGR